MPKRSYEKAFERRFLNSVNQNGFYVKIDMFKVLNKIDDINTNKNRYNIRTSENNNFSYDDSVIMKRSKSATSFDRVEKFTKTELIELFARISVNDVWSAEYETFDKTDDWQKKLASTIKGLSIEEAGKYIKKNFKTFGKGNRRIIGHKINTNSDNNYYMVRDLEIHFDLLEEDVDVEFATNYSIRNLDVNSLQFLIFNGVKYILKGSE